MFDHISWPWALGFIIFLLFLVWIFCGKKVGQARLDLNTQDRSAIFHLLGPPSATTIQSADFRSHDHIVTTVGPTLRTIVLDNPLPRPRPWANPRPSQGELRCKEVLEAIFDRPFVTVRPDFLKNPQTKRNLELDCYNHDLRLAVEYQGSHHYPPRNPTPESMAKYNYRCQLDQLKVERCQENGIDLIIVPNTLKLPEIEGYIKDHLPSHFRALLPPDNQENART